MTINSWLKRCSNVFEYETIKIWDIYTDTYVYDGPQAEFTSKKNSLQSCPVLAFSCQGNTINFDTRVNP